MKMKNIPFIIKYKPTRFNQFEQLDSDIVSLLHSLITLNNLNILVIGNTGIGKTSIINSIIHEYYGELYDSDNILILNSLKEQGIQFYRNEFKTFCQTCSLIKNKKKIVLMDDIDYINEQSQQAFRNCMDKYKHNVHFISSCTNIQKVIDSLQSRSIVVQITPITYISLCKIMNNIKTQESIDMDKEAELFILKICNNSIRLLINYLEKIKILNCKIDLEIANRLCTNISHTIFDSYTKSALQNDIGECIKMFYNLYDDGYSVMDILDNYFVYVKMTQLLTETLKYKTIKLICKYIVYFNNIHEDEIELALFSNNIVELFIQSVVY